MTFYYFLISVVSVFRFAHSATVHSEQNTTIQDFCIQYTHALDTILDFPSVYIHLGIRLAEYMFKTGCYIYYEYP